MPNLAGKVSNTVLLLENGAATGGSGGTTHTSSTPGKVPIVKRRRQGDGGDEVDTDMTNEAASEMEDRRSQ